MTATRYPTRATRCALLLGVALTPAFSPLTQAQTNAYTFTTIAGYSGYGIDDGPASKATFYETVALAVAPDGAVYCADPSSHTVRKIATNGIVSTIAGLPGYSGVQDGIGSEARFYGPFGIAVGRDGTVFLADGAAIRQIDTQGRVSTFAGSMTQPGTADGPAGFARFESTGGLAADSAGDLYVADWSGNRIRRVGPDGTVSTLAAGLKQPMAVAVDAAGDLYVLEDVGQAIRKITPDGTVSTLAGDRLLHGSVDGQGAAARFYYPSGIAVNAAGVIFVADTENRLIRAISPAGLVTTIAGAPSQQGTDDGQGPAARFLAPVDIAADAAGNLFVADQGMIRKIAPGTNVTTYAGHGRAPSVAGTGDGFGPDAQFFWGDMCLAAGPKGDLYLAQTYSHVVRRLTADGAVTTVAGLAQTPGFADGHGAEARFQLPGALVADTNGNLFVVDIYNYAIRKITPNGDVTTLCGSPENRGLADGTGALAQFADPGDIALDPAGNLWVSDSGRLRKVTPAGTVSTMSGLVDDQGNPFTFSSLSMVIDNSGTAYVNDHWDFTIRKVSPAGVVTLFAGKPQTPGTADGIGQASFLGGLSMALAPSGGLIVADGAANTIRFVSPLGEVTTIAGLAPSFSGEDTRGPMDGTGPAARFGGYMSVAVDASGRIFVADPANYAIRLGVPSSSVPRPLLSAPATSAGQFGFTLTGGEGLCCYVEESGDLAQWRVTGTYTIHNGTAQFTTPTSPAGRKFYRARLR